MGERSGKKAGILAAALVAAAIAIACGGEIESGFLEEIAATRAAEVSATRAAQTAATSTVLAQRLNDAITRGSRPGSGATPIPLSTPAPPVQRQPGDRPVISISTVQPASATPVPTPTSTPSGTPPPGPASTASPTEPAPTPGPQSTPVPTATPAPSFHGPYTGSLVHLENGDEAEEFSTGVDVSDFLAAATFVNPFSASMRTWTIGAWFRVERKPGTFWTQGFSFPATEQQGMMVVLESSGRWTLLHRTSIVASQGTQITDTPVQTGFASAVNRDAGEENTIKVLAVGDTGMLLINGAVAAELDLSNSPPSGDFVALAGVLEEDEYSGSVTQVHSILVSEPATANDYGGSTGPLMPGQTRTVAADVEGDFIFNTEVPVTTPIFSGTWSWEVAVEADLETYRLSVGSDLTARIVRERLLEDGGTETATVFSSSISGLSIKQGETNRASIVSFDGRLGFVVNGTVLQGVTPEVADSVDITVSGFVRGEQSAMGAVVQPGMLLLWQPVEPDAS